MLHQFSKDHKVICSKFSQLFVTCYNKFIHPKMCKLNLVPEYFVEPSNENWELISGILKETLPECLVNKRLSNASKHINIPALLIPLWCCFNTEEVFKIHLNEILNHWALLLSEKNELFLYNSRDQLVPVIPPQNFAVPPSVLTVPPGNFTLMAKPITSQLNIEVFEIFKTCGMPVLDIKVVNLSLCASFCPQIDQPVRMLQNLSILHQAGEIKTLLQDKNFDRKIAKLFIYFGAINFTKDKDSSDRIKSLPFFKNIDNSYNPLTGETYVWPSHICLVGRTVWMDGIKAASVVFLKPDGVWSNLGPAATLGIDIMSPWSLYTKFIFPCFHLLNDGDRMKQLKHIRDTPELFDTAHYDSEAKNDSDRKKDALSFVNALKDLPCIQKGDELRVVSTFCDPDVQLFKEFSSIYEFPPDILCDKKWLAFFRKLGLKGDISKEEFTTLCEEVNTRYQKSPSKASQTLMRYLFGQHEWHTDTDFLDEVSELPFVCTEPLNKLSSIVPAFKTRKAKRQGKQMVCFTSLNKASSKEIDHLVWTVMPVVKLPRLFYTLDTIPAWKLKDMKEKFYNDLHICKVPVCSQVVKNLLNISKSDFSNFDLFDTYHEDIHHRGKEELLFEVIVDCFNFLSNNCCSMEDLQPLLGTHCIPVSTNGEVSEIRFSVLVSPCQVIADRSEAVKELVPFLNPLPEDLYSAYPTILSVMGVSQEIQFDNVRYALKIMHDHLEQPLDINTIDILKKLIKYLYFWLCRSVDNLSPSFEVLYLPNDHRELIESKKLIYNDRENYKDAELNYSFMSLLVNEFEERSVYGFCLRDLYLCLPESVRPLALSQCSVERLSNICKRDQMKLTSFATKLKQALSHPNFTHIMALIIQGLSPSTSKIIRNKFEEALTIFHQSVTVYSVYDLRTDVLLSLNGKQPTPIGTAKVDFLLESNMQNKSFTLYVDSDVDALTMNLFESLSRNIVSITVNKCMVIAVPDDFIDPAEKAVGILLKGPPPEQLRKFLNNLGMNTIGLQLQHRINSEFIPVLGEPIPPEMYHRLQSDIHNVFRTHELVGYEDKENHIIFARVEYLIYMEKYYETREEQGSNNDDVGYEIREYMIVTSESDDEVRQVSVVELYKILRMKQAKLDDGSTDIVLYDPESVGVQMWDAVKDEKLCSVMQKICEDLKCIWRLTDTVQKRKAVKSMCLKWHPDKNPSPLATEAFQFLQHQVKELDRENSNGREDHSRSDTHSPDWDNNFQEFKKLVNKWKDCLKSEKESLHENQPCLFDDGMYRASCKVCRDPRKAVIWFKQAKHDLKALHVLFDSSSEGLYAHVCFMAHQVAEKALKAGMYQVLGLPSEHLDRHKLVGLAKKLEENSTAHGLEELADRLMNDRPPYVNYYLDTRYPNRSDSVPSDNFTFVQAREAKDAAEKILKIIGQIIR